MKKSIKFTAKQVGIVIRKAKKEIFDDVEKQTLYAVDKGGGKIKYIKVGESDWFKLLKKKYLQPK